MCPGLAVLTAGISRSQPSPRIGQRGWKGQPAGGVIGAAASGAPLCISAVVLDGVVVAHSACDSGLNYRSVLVTGTGREVEDPAEAELALRAITERAGIVAAGTLVSRLLGAARDSVIAACFTLEATDAFFVAFRLPNLWRRLVGEGSMTISFVPVYTEYLTQRSEDESKTLTHIAFTLGGTLLALLTILGIVFSSLLIRLIAPGWFIDSPEKFQLTVFLNRIIFPYIFFMGLFALAMGMLNSRRHFFAPSLAPVFLNISMILSILLLVSHLDPPVLALAIGVLAGGVFQFATTGETPVVPKFGTTIVPIVISSIAKNSKSFLKLA